MPKVSKVKGFTKRMSAVVSKIVPDVSVVHIEPIVCIECPPMQKIYTNVACKMQCCVRNQLENTIYGMVYCPHIGAWTPLFDVFGTTEEILKSSFPGIDDVLLRQYMHRLEIMKGYFSEGHVKHIELVKHFAEIPLPLLAWGATCPFLKNLRVLGARDCLKCNQIMSELEDIIERVDAPNVRKLAEIGWHL